MTRTETVLLTILGLELIALVLVTYPQIRQVGDSRDIARWHMEAMESYDPAGPVRPGGPDLPTAAKQTGEIPILMYHHIRDNEDPDDLIGVRLSVSPESFADQLSEIQRLGYQTITFEDLANGDIPRRPIILTFDDGYRETFTRAFPELAKRHMKAVVFIVTKYIGANNFMSREQLAEMARNGIELGSHTVSHPYLTRLSDEKKKTEILDSKKDLERISKRPIISFCYPFGDYDDATIKVVEDAGYKYAVTTVTGEASISSPFLLKRVRVPDRTTVSSLLQRIHSR